MVKSKIKEIMVFLKNIAFFNTEHIYKFVM